MVSFNINRIAFGLFFYPSGIQPLQLNKYSLTYTIMSNSSNKMPDFIDMYVRAHRELIKGDNYFFLYQGAMLYGKVDGDPTTGSEIYMKTYDEALKANKWFLIKRKWIFTPRDYCELLN